MAQLGNTVVNGSLRVIGDFYANGYIDTTVTLTSSGWSGTDLFTQTVKVAGVKADNNYRVYQYISSGATAAEIKTYLKNFSYVVSGYATPADGSITFTTIKKPTANVTVRIVGDSNVERTTVENSEVTSMKSDIASINTSLNTLNTSKNYVLDNHNGAKTTFGYSQTLDFNDCECIGGWKNYELQALPKSVFQGALLVKSFSISLTGWTAASPSYFMNIQNTLTANSIAANKVLRIDVTNYNGKWKNYNFQVYGGSMYIFCDKNEDTTATLKVIYLP